MPTLQGMTEVPPDVRRLDPRALRGLAHPLRMRLLSVLRSHGPATASGLADRLGESSGATSYHLRQLAAYGFVEDDPGRGTARERWWKSVHRGSQLDSIGEFLQHPDPAVRGAMGVFMHEASTQHAQQLDTWLGTMHEWPEKWQLAWDMSDFAMRLTPELAEELTAQVHTLIESYRQKAVTEEETSSVRIHLHVFPHETD
ncbi:winged helix-turn-helix domain-containing protein [Streptomyces sp. H39-S7]|uniref:winged helix-turn-helix domain-containing protein n=1 Tax=Streptomyces sp. H39-S7 TaxID=3004357 RepID=UPI0022AF92A1|nr:helix-turn-helix domain-containing protein [Streptomyces sp. H39-S7]MCZ4118820.1 helix-turn-helix domain-containing protein [Streptomyces sp. H39-S7]